MKKQTPENLVKQEIKDWLGIMGWFFFPILQGLGCYPGIPDIIACKNGLVLFIEAKSEKGELSEDQKDFKSNIEYQLCYYIEARGYEDIENYLKNVGGEEEDDKNVS